MRSWIKLYTEILNDPKMGRLTDRQFRTCVSVFLLAGMIDEDSVIGTTGDIAWHLRADREDVAEDLAVLARLGILELDDDNESWIVRNFERRQARPPSAEPDAVSARVKRHRAKLQGDGNEDVTAPQRGCNEDVTTPQRGVTPSDPDPDPDPDPETESVGAASGAPAAPDPSPNGALTAPRPELKPEHHPPGTFADWQRLVEKPPPGSNRQAQLLAMFQALYPGRASPEYAQLGQAARACGGAGRLAELLWQNASRPPAGDVVAYCIAAHKRQKGGNPNGNGRRELTDDHYAGSEN
jgi:hypothetical protein